MCVNSLLTTKQPLVVNNLQIYWKSGGPVFPVLEKVPLVSENLIPPGFPRGYLRVRHERPNLQVRSI